VELQIVEIWQADQRQETEAASTAKETVVILAEAVQEQIPEMRKQVNPLHPGEPLQAQAKEHLREMLLWQTQEKVPAERMLQMLIPGLNTIMKMPVVQHKKQDIRAQAVVIREIR
jgi:hypothetical protein